MHIALNILLIWSCGEMAKWEHEHETRISNSHLACDFDLTLHFVLICHFRKFRFQSSAQHLNPIFLLKTDPKLADLFHLISSLSSDGLKVANNLHKAVKTRNYKYLK